MRFQIILVVNVFQIRKVLHREWRKTIQLLSQFVIRKTSTMGQKAINSSNWIITHRINYS